MSFMLLKFILLHRCNQFVWHTRIFFFLVAVSTMILYFLHFFFGYSVVISLEVLHLFHVQLLT